MARAAGSAGLALGALGPHGLGASTLLRTAFAQSSPAEPADWDVPDGHFYTQTAGPDAPAETGFVVSDADGVGFWGDYQALGGPGLLGYPISSRYETNGETYQAFQSGLLRWDAASGRAEVAPVFAGLAELGLDDWAVSQGIPPASPQLREAPSLPFDARSPWLTNPTLRDAYASLGGADTAGLLGLPMGEPERAGPYLAQRFERGALQLWLDDLPEQPDPGTVSLVQVGDLLKTAGLIPGAALVPQPAPAPRPAPPPATPSEPPPARPAAVPAVAPGGGRQVVVSLGQQWWYAYQDGAVVYSSPVTTGRPELATPMGRFTVLSRHSPFTFISPWPVGNRFWYAPSPCTYALRITGNGVFLHDSPWRTAYGPGTNLPQNGSDGVARTGSHGCINLPFAAAQFLWGFAPIGTTVNVIA